MIGFQPELIGSIIVLFTLSCLFGAIFDIQEKKKRYLLTSWLRIRVLQCFGAFYAISVLFAFYRFRSYYP